jgi:hypothetical protein
MSEVDVLSVLSRRGKRLRICAAASAALLLYIFSVYPHPSDRAPTWLNIICAVFIFLSIGYTFGWLGAYRRKYETSVLQSNNLNIEMKIARSIGVDKAKRAFCLMGTSYVVVWWDKIKDCQLEWESVDGKTHYYILFNVSDFDRPTIRHKIGFGRGIGPEGEARKAFAQVSMLLNGEA